MSYRGGVYSPKTTQSTGMHAVTAIGYGPGYILAVNTWRDRWGDKGFFKIKYGCCQMVFWIMKPSPISKGAFPLVNGSGLGHGPGGSRPLLKATYIESASPEDVKLCIGQRNTSS